MGLKYFFVRIEEEFEMVYLTWKKKKNLKNHPLKVHGNLKTFYINPW